MQENDTAPKPFPTGSILPPEWFARPAPLVAEALLGMELVRTCDRRTLRARITETEAYEGMDDLASHASKGKTPRTAVMFGPPAHWYVYLCYGMHWMLNVVTGREGHPGAVLIRGVEGTCGPGRVTRTYAVDKSLNGMPLTQASGLWIEQGTHVDVTNIVRTPRIGVDYAKEWKDKEWRYIANE